MEHKVRMACLFCFVLDLLDTLTRSNDLIPHQSYPSILIGLECFCEFSRVSFSDFALHWVIVFIGLPYQKHFLSASTVSQDGDKQGPVENRDHSRQLRAQGGSDHT